MKELDNGHVYELDNLKSDKKTVFTFYKDPKFHSGYGLDGPSTQEVLRMCIARVRALNEELPSEINDAIIYRLRQAIGLFECRALMRSIDKGEAVEDMEPGTDGHIFS